jgi:peptidoglycan/LPS O-acetylase OafA/YrhL
LNDRSDILAERVAQTSDFGRRMPGLDVVRGLAIVGVLLYHGTGFFYGRMGVHLFFVLSGFLIAGILLDTRADSSYYKNFYVRRFLRIVPAYLLMIVALKVFGAISWTYIGVCLLYICNMSKLFHSSPEYGPFWSLSVEEQFYLTWPFIIRRLSVPNIFRLCIGIILLAPILRYGLQFLPSVFADIHFKTWDVVDFFAAGTLLAISVRSPIIRPHLPRVASVLLISGCVLVAGIAWMLPIASGSWSKLATALEPCPYVVLFAGVVLLGFLMPGIASTWAGRFASFLGDISYGLYLCHQFLFACIDRWLLIHDNWVTSMTTQIWLRFLLKATVSIGVAFLSRRYFEAIFLRMKPKRLDPGKSVGKASKQKPYEED